MLTYQEFLDHIFLRYSGNVKLGLDRMEGILKDMDSPNEKLRGIHIAGTNGKGSTSAACEALALQHGHITGLNTSPHLVDYCERFRIQGKNVDFSEILRIYHEWEAVFQKWDASFFEITTAIAFQLFNEKKIGTSIFEVGLGGRLDGTNPFHSTVCIITTISMDHPKSLGDTIEKIAFEKAGIIKQGVPVVLGPIQPSALEVIKKVALERNAPTYQFGTDFYIENVVTGEHGTFFDYHFPEMQIHYENIQSNLLGKYQATNMSLALTSFILYNKLTDQPYSEANIRSAMAKIAWQGRLQVIRKKAIILLDGAHNDEGVDSLITNLREIFPNKRYRFVTAILHDKPYGSMLRKMNTIADHFYITQNHSDRAATIEDEVKILAECQASYETMPDVVSATKKALDECRENDMVVVCGSLHTVAEVLENKELMQN
ncbi:MAG TPA: folylpolyglutamate synthase/dihydrofolate synthase family protein [Candidatus Cloacimonadota bacterium]|nr:folylpolyglutamate synthase/dihydrofolate synthase family protein [Candidatus Cloacimonadota bacterium]HPT72929.1 folylpolyglutamate synthase/dihydrofolate synthase family protein [Candidatus Cloacimonadota bacterium]